jgi:cobyrinic acid a,c-diamide synthase
VLVMEGVMGLFDGSAQPGTDGSTAAVAKSLSAPVVLVVDASAMSGSVAAVVHGFATLDPEVGLAGVILNQVGSPGHADLLREALDPLGIPIWGVIQRDDGLAWRERHLGLVPVVEDPGSVRAALSRLAGVIAASCDLGGLAGVARSAPEVAVGEPPGAREQVRARVALAAGPAFSFAYPENLELFEQAGAELVPFDPCTDHRLPEGVQALYAGGGFPEAYATTLGANTELMADVRARARAGLVVWAECGGLLWLSQSLDGVSMVGALPTRARMSDRLTIGYRRAQTRAASPLGPAGTYLKGHEFHRTVTEPDGEALDLSGRGGDSRSGFVSPTLFASYLHQHLSATPATAEAFIAAAGAATAKG